MASDKKRSAKEQLHTEVGSALKESRGGFVGVGWFSVFINLLMLTGPLYMLQVYDRVLLSRSVETLLTFSVIMAACYAFMGFLEFCRARVLTRIGNHLDEKLGRRTFNIWMKQGLMGPAGKRHQPLNDLNSLRQFLGSSAPGTFFDLPWVPIYIFVIFMFHWMLGVAATIGAILIFIVAFRNERRTQKPQKQAQIERAKAQMFAMNAHRNADAIMAMGMNDHVQGRWRTYADGYSDIATETSDITGSSTAVSKSFRMFLQSGILGLGGYLAVKQVITPGTMIAASIIMGRALAPVQMALSQWKGFTAARQAYERLNAFYDIVEAEENSLELPEPVGAIKVENMFAAPPGSKKAVLSGLNFELKPGEGLGVIGPSASGKSTLARLLVGIWMPQKGSVRLDGATFDQWNRDTLGPFIGYLPQTVELFDGTIGENISRFRPDATDQQIVEAAMKAGVHEMVLAQADGYDTILGEGGAVLSGGQTQRIGLARALFGAPKLVLLDEPNSNLDADGDAALSKAIADMRANGTTVIVMAHRPSAIASVDKLLVLRDGRQVAFGPKDEVLKEITKPVQGSSQHRPAARAGTGTQGPLSVAAGGNKPALSVPIKKRSITKGGPAGSLR